MKLRQLKESDAEGMLEWMQDPQIVQWFRFSPECKERAAVLEFIRDSQSMVLDGTSIHYAIAGQNDDYLGTISLKNINLTDRNAEYAISLRAGAQGKGIGLSATGLLLKKAFYEFGMERVYLNVLEDNKKAIRLYENAGFVYEGAFRKGIFLRGNYRTLKWYSMLREEYLKKCGGGEDEPVNHVRICCLPKERQKFYWREAV